jgi:hypothetical protein
LRVRGLGTGIKGLGVAVEGWKLMDLRAGWTAREGASSKSLHGFKVRVHGLGVYRMGIPKSRTGWPAARPRPQPEALSPQPWTLSAGRLCTTAQTIPSAFTSKTIVFTQRVVFAA